MTDKAKKVLRIVSGVLVASGAIIFVAVGGTEAGALGIASSAIAVSAGVIAFIKSIIK